MKIIPQILGLLAVACFFLCYQLKRRKDIIFLNFISRCLYFIQYILLGAFSGAIFDILAAVVSVLAAKKNTDFIKKHIKFFVIISNALILIIGLFIAYLSKSVLDLFALAGVLLEINAMWPTRENVIRLISLLAIPFWLTYNLLSGAYGSAIGNVLIVFSIITALIRYRNYKSEEIS